MFKRLLPAILATALTIQIPALAASSWQEDLKTGEAALAEGRYADAIAPLKNALDQVRATSPDSVDEASCAIWLGNAYYRQGRYPEAEPLYKRSLAIYEKVHGPDHPAVGTALNNLAALYESQGRYAEAEPLYKRSLAIRGESRQINSFLREARKKRFDLSINEIVRRGGVSSGSQAKEAGVSESSLLSLLQSQPLHDCMPQFQEILGRRTRLFGKADPRTSEALLQIAIAFDTMGGSAKDQVTGSWKSLQKFARALVGKKDNPIGQELIADLGGRDGALDYTFKVLSCLGCALAGTGQDNDAGEAFDLARQCLLARTNVDTGTTVGKLLQLASYRQLMADYGDAEKNIAEATDRA